MRIKGRGALSNAEGRFAKRSVELDEPDAPGHLDTELHADRTRSIITENRSPDVPFSQSINVYRGCEHGCIYCFARPTHAYLDLSPGRDFETQIFYKPDAVALLRAALAKPGYVPKTLAMGTNTDPYQPAERRLALTRGVLELMLELEHPVSIVTKSALVLRDIDLLVELAKRDLVEIAVSVTTLDAELKRAMEPRTAGPEQRLATVRGLAETGVPTGVLAAPIIPVLNDHEVERIVARSAEAGARFAGYVLLRLPHEVKPLFIEWLRDAFPERAEHVLSRLRQMRGGGLNDPRFHSRQQGAGPFAELLAARFARACRAHGLNAEEARPLDTSRFKRPRPDTPQRALF